MERQDQTHRRSFWDKRHSPLQAITIIAVLLVALPILLLVLWIGAVFVTCSVQSSCLMG